jgi:hypothetical protein
MSRHKTSIAAGEIKKNGAAIAAPSRAEEKIGYRRLSRP